MFFNLCVHANVSYSDCDGFWCFIKQLAINQAIREADEEDDGDDVDIPLEDEAQQPALQGSRTRNRPKREA